MKLTLLCLIITSWLSVYNGYGALQRNLRMTSGQSYLSALNSGQWMKFISGASNQDAPLIRNLCYLYTLVGADCIDVSADWAVIDAALDGINSALLSSSKCNRPLLMISVNDGEDDHFRKAYFDPVQCPSDCPRPCEKVCPAWAIDQQGVSDAKCYGCGRCFQICPFDFIQPKSYITSIEQVLIMLDSGTVDAIEIHTKEGHSEQFRHLWKQIQKQVCTRLQVISISFNDMKEHTIPYIEELYSIMSESQHYGDFQGVHIWQTDGRSMSGDIGKGTIHAANNLGKYILQSSAEKKLRKIDFSQGRHFVQLAGGTNSHSKQAAREDSLLSYPGFGGFAFGGYARKAISQKMFDSSVANPFFRVEECGEIYGECQDFAAQLIKSVKET